MHERPSNQTACVSPLALATGRSRLLLGRGGHVDFEWPFQEKGRLAVVPVLSNRGLTAHYEGGVARFVNAGDLVPKGPHSHNLGDCF